MKTNKEYKEMNELELKNELEYLFDLLDRTTRFADRININIAIGYCESKYNRLKRLNK